MIIILVVLPTSFAEWLAFWTNEPPRQWIEARMPSVPWDAVVRILVVGAALTLLVGIFRNEASGPAEIQQPHDREPDLEHDALAPVYRAWGQTAMEQLSNLASGMVTDHAGGAPPAERAAIDLFKRNVVDPHVRDMQRLRSSDKPHRGWAQAFLDGYAKYESLLMNLWTVARPIGYPKTRQEAERIIAWREADRRFLDALLEAKSKNGLERVRKALEKWAGVNSPQRAGLVQRAEQVLSQQ